MKSSLTGIKDLDKKIMQDLSDRDLFNYCQNFPCDDEIFWKTRFFNKFKNMPLSRRKQNIDTKAPDKTWKKFYLQIASIMNLEDLDELEEFGDYQYVEFYKRILLESLGKWDVFDFFIRYFGERYAPFMLTEGVDDLLRLNSDEMILDLLDNNVATFPVLRKILNDAPSELIEKIKNGIDFDDNQEYLYSVNMIEYIGTLHMLMSEYLSFANENSY